MITKGKSTSEFLITVVVQILALVMFITGHVWSEDHTVYTIIAGILSAASAAGYDFSRAKVKEADRKAEAVEAASRPSS